MACLVLRCVAVVVLTFSSFEDSMQVARDGKVHYFGGCCLIMNGVQDGGLRCSAAQEVGFRDCLPQEVGSRGGTG